MDWLGIQDRYRNSVLQIICVRARYQIDRPYLSPIDGVVRGSGFLVDISNGLVVTNAHVIKDAISIRGRSPKTGQRDLNLRLISYCIQRDIALCQLGEEEISLLTKGVQDPADLNMTFGDDLDIRQTQEVLTVGYPLGQENIKFTTGVIAGFQDILGQEETERIVSFEEDPSFIQITAPINPGNSGGPLLNSKGEVIGVNAAGHLFSQNVGYAIGSRCILAIWDLLQARLHDPSLPYRVTVPRLSVNWNKTNPALLQLKTGCCAEDDRGIYVREVYPNSCCPDLKNGDIILSISYYNTLFTPGEVTARLDNFGKVILDGQPNLPSSRDRFSLKELLDIIPCDSPISIEVGHGEETVVYEAVYSPSTHYVTSFVSPRFEPLDYQIFAGICVSPITLDLAVQNSEELEPYVRGKKRYRRYLVINQIFPDTTASRSQILSENQILKRVNGVEVSSMEDLRSVLEPIYSQQKGDQILTIETCDKSLFAVRVSDMMEEDQMVLELFNIPTLSPQQVR